MCPKLEPNFFWQSQNQFFPKNNFLPIAIYFVVSFVRAILFHPSVSITQCLLFLFGLCTRNYSIIGRKFPNICIAQMIVINYFVRVLFGLFDSLLPSTVYKKITQYDWKLLEKFNCFYAIWVLCAVDQEAKKKWCPYSKRVTPCVSVNVDFNRSIWLRPRLSRGKRRETHEIMIECAINIDGKNK